MGSAHFSLSSVTSKSDLEKHIETLFNIHKELEVHKAAIQKYSVEKTVKKLKGRRRKPVLSVEERAHAGAVAPGDVVVFQECDRKVRLMLVEELRAGKVTLRWLQQRVLATHVEVKKGMHALVTWQGRKRAGR